MFEINPGLFLWSLLTFVLLVGLLYKFAFGPLMALQQQRQDEIHASIAESERLREEAFTLLEDYKKQLAAARHDAEEIMERARKVGDATKSEIIEEAKAQADRNLDKAREQIERETRQALVAIRQEVADLTVLATEKVARKSLSSEDHLKMIKDSLDEIDLSKISEN